MSRISSVAIMVFGVCSAAVAGVYSGPKDKTHPIDPAISKSDSRIIEWADVVVDYSPAPGVSPTYQNPETGYGSLGDLSQEQIDAGVAVGTITVGFSTGIGNGPGQDFAVFENGFTYGSPNGLFMELAYVEVSSDGMNFARFDGISTNTTPVAGSGGFSGWDTSNVYNLAGKHASGYGTQFDLDQLAGHALVIAGELDLWSIQYVRLVDIPGTGYFQDSLGNGILDAWPTSGSGGYDFRLSEGVAVLSGPIPEPASAVVFAGLGAIGLIGYTVRRRRRSCRSA